MRCASSPRTGSARWRRPNKRRGSREDGVMMESSGSEAWLNTTTDRRTHASSGLIVLLVVHHGALLLQQEMNPAGWAELSRAGLAGWRPIRSDTGENYVYTQCTRSVTYGGTTEQTGYSDWADDAGCMAAAAAASAASFRYNEWV